MKTFSIGGKTHRDYQMISDFITSPREYMKATLSDDPLPLPKQASAAGK